MLFRRDCSRGSLTSRLRRMTAKSKLVKFIRFALYAGKVDYNTLEASFLVASILILLAGMTVCVECARLVAYPVASVSECHVNHSGN